MPTEEELKQFNDGLIPAFKPPLNNEIELGTMLKVFPTKGNLVYEYNPFLNFRLEENAFYYKGHYYTREGLESNFGVTVDDAGTAWSGTDGEEPILYEAGMLVDFDTEQLQFDINHPVDILPQYSYDGSVNLVLNDGKNIPRMVNSRFTSLGKNTYEIIDRKGDNDVNIYDQGKQFDIDTSLYKRVVEIPDIDFIGVYPGGNLKVGNYVFYFKYMDDDGNETDFVGESGVVSIFIGDTMTSINGGIQDQNAYKSVRFSISNIDPGYSYVTVYYTRTTSDESSIQSMSAHKITDKFEVTQSLSCQINITGFANEEEITAEEINMQYFIASSAWTQATAQNRLFLANIHKPDIPYKELSDLSLRIFPIVGTRRYDLPNYDYMDGTRNTYFDPNFIYNYTGYANGGELYSFGIVYIMSDNSLSPVFPIMGGLNIVEEDLDVLEGTNPIQAGTDGDGQFSRIDIYRQNPLTGKYDLRNYISYNEDTGQVISQPDGNYTITDRGNAQNIWGVSSFNVMPDQGNGTNDTNTIYYVNFRMYEANYKPFFDILAANNIKGFFFVRKKRIPIRLCQALCIYTDKMSYTPVVPVDSELPKEYGVSGTIGDETAYLTERFLDDEQLLSVDFAGRLYGVDENSTIGNAAICPDYDCWPGYYNQIFNGSTFYLTNSSFMPDGNHLIMDALENRHLYMLAVNNNSYNSGTARPFQVVTIPDGSTIVSIRNSNWRARAGEAEEAFRFEYIERENKTNDAANLVRGLWGNYIGLDGRNEPCTMVDIKSSEAYGTSPYDLIKTRYADKSAYYAISKRMALRTFYSNENKLNSFAICMADMGNVYRGDSFICLFTHRFNRNFQDPESPNNHKIVDEECWKNGYNYEEGDFEDINRGDVNAVQLGMWITFPVISNRNLNIRSLDLSYPEEEALTGHKRGYYPYYAINTDGSFKIPESTIHNSGISANVGERWNYPVPDVPYLKNQFQTRILYSDIHVNDAFKNGFRVFQALSYKDYPRTYGMIVRLVELEGNILCVCEHGIMLIPVNERVEAGAGDGGSVFINTKNVLPDNPKVISDMFGSQWPESVIKTPFGIYGVDTVGKKIWRTDGNTLELISDFKIQEYLNQNITLTERETTPIIGVRNVKTHYNAFKKDVMFTFYDDTKGFEEKVWNICYNELLGQFITFYSWVPSYSASIDNIYFSFDRNTSKWIGKLGICKEGNSFSDGIVLSNNIIRRGEKRIGKLNVVDAQIPKLETGIGSSLRFTICRDNFNNYRMFHIEGTGDEQWLCLNDGVDYDTLLANIFTMDQRTGRRVFMDYRSTEYKDTIVYQLNIRCDVVLSYDGDDENIKQYVNGWNDYQTMDVGYYEYSIVIIPEDNVQYLTTDFWKHGQAGIIDIKDKIAPCVWYARQHPMEVEFVVVDDSTKHKIFENLEIIGNYSEPESFHYEITGDYYEWEDDKLNIYFRQEALKALYQYNGSDILYNRDFMEITPKQRVFADYNDKSTLFPFYYARQDRFDYIEDYYRLSTSPDCDYQNLSGTEIVHYETLDEYRMWTHVKACAINKEGRLRGNMWYKEDKWYVQIPSINFVQKNEETWPEGTATYIDENGIERNISLPPIVVGNSPIPGDMLNTNITDNDFPEELKSLGYGITDIDTSDWGTNYVNQANLRKEALIRDKYCKIRIRYSGKKMVVIQAIKTIYYESEL